MKVLAYSLPQKEYLCKPAKGSLQGKTNRIETFSPRLYSTAMEHLAGSLVLFLPLFLGLLTGKLPWTPPARLRQGGLSFALYGLLFSMGWTSGQALTTRLQTAQAGGASLLAAAAALIGTLAVLLAGYRLFPGSRLLPAEEKKSHTLRHLLHHLREPLVPLGFVAAGFLWSRLVPLYPQEELEIFISAVLYLLLFLVGLQLALDRVPLRSVFRNPAVLLLPAGTLAGTLLGSLLLIPLLGLSPGKAAAVVSGFGWYSLSGVLITDLGDPYLGSVAFLSNLMRESMAMLLIPFLGRSPYPGMAVGAGGATSMDVTLPLIEKACGSRIVPYSVISGTLLSLTVPVLVPLFYSLG